jgi:hypothetical protein
MQRTCRLLLVLATVLPRPLVRPTRPLARPNRPLARPNWPLARPSLRGLATTSWWSTPWRLSAAKAQRTSKAPLPPEGGSALRGARNDTRLIVDIAACSWAYNASSGTQLVHNVQMQREGSERPREAAGYVLQGSVSEAGLSCLNHWSRPGEVL